MSFLFSFHKKMPTYVLTYVVKEDGWFSLTCFIIQEEKIVDEAGVYVDVYKR